MYKDSCTQYS